MPVAAPIFATPIPIGALMFTDRLIPLMGLGVMIGCAWALSSQRERFPWRVVLWGLGLQFVFALLTLKTAPGLWLFSQLNRLFNQLLSFTDEGSKMIFGAYFDKEFTFALHVLPTIIFFSALMSVFYHLGLMQKLVHGLAWVMQKTMRTSGAETLSASANIFVGQTEAPLVVKPFLASMTRSEIMAVMVCGFAGIAGGVLAAYVGLLGKDFPAIAGHLIAQSVLSAPAGLLIAKVMEPETERPSLDIPEDKNKPHANVIDAAAAGASEGLQLALNVAAMLIAFMALVALINAVLKGTLHVGGAPLSLERIFAWIFWPVAFVMGVPADECSKAAVLLGERITTNEFVAYAHFAENLKSAHPFSERARVILSYALCGFANFGSIAIQVGGIGVLVPEKRALLAKLGLRAMIGGMLASYMTACVAAVLL